MVNFLSPEEVWQNEEIISPTFDQTILRAYETPLGDITEFYFNGKVFSDGVVRIFGVLAVPKNIPNPKVVLVCHDIGSPIDTSYIDFFLGQKFAVFMCDTFGEAEGRKYTFYPSSIKYANRVHAEKVLYKSDKSPKSNPFFEWTNVYRYGIEFLKTRTEVDGQNIVAVGVREGAVPVWHLSFLGEVKGAVALYYAGWKEYGNSYKYSDDMEKELSNEEIAYSAGISPQAYASFIKTPFLFLTASNNELTNLDRAFDTMARINGAVDSMTMVSPNSLSAIGYFASRDLKLFLQKYLNEMDIALPFKPMISVMNLGGKLCVKCEIDEEQAPLHIVVYKAEGTHIPTKRCWQASALAAGSEGYAGTIDISDSSQTTYIFANVEYKNGFSATSNFLAVSPSELGINVELIKQNLIYTGFMGLDTFTGLGESKDYTADEVFADKRIVELKETFDGVYGISSPKNLSTFKLSTPAFCGEEDNLLIMDIFSEEPQTIKLIATCNFSDENEVEYVAELKTVGGPLWQNFKFEVCDFVDTSLSSMKRWEDISLLKFVSEKAFVLNNMLWI